MFLIFAYPIFAIAGTEPFEMNEGISAFDNDDWKQAVEYLTIAVQKDPSLWKAYQYLAYAYYEQHNLAQSLAACDKSLALKPDNGDLPGFRNKVQKDIDAASATPLPPWQAPSAPGISSGYPDNCKTLYASVGISSPYDPANFKSGFVPGYSAGGGVGLGLSKIFSLILDLQVNDFPLSSKDFPGENIEGGDITDIIATLNAKFRFIPDDNPVVPYGVVGLGLSLYDEAPATVTSLGFPPSSTAYSGSSSASACFRLALGIDIKLQPGQYIFVESNGIAASTGFEDITYNIVRVGFISIMDGGPPVSPTSQ
jgi:tetratricopeptide (TPR) repeat protein